MPALMLTALNDDSSFEADSLKGHVTLLNFFASWCGPCAAEMPELAALKKRFPQLRIEGIAWNDDGQDLKRWVAKHGKPFDKIWLDTSGSAAVSLGVDGIPESFIVDAHGVIRHHVAGPITSELRQEKLHALLSTLEEEARNASPEE